MSDKTKVAELLDRIQVGWAPPEPLEDASLLEQGMLFVLSRTLTVPQAQQTVKALRAAYPDWNELRISQVQEFREHIKTKNDQAAYAAAADVRSYLQEIFQRNHGFDIEFLREDSPAGPKFASELRFLGGAASHLLLSFAGGGELPVTPSVIRMLDRLGLVPRSGSVKKAKEKIAPLVPEGRVQDFAVRFGWVAETFCDPKKPICWECTLVEVCKHGTRVFKDWKAQQKRLEILRKKEEKRLEVLRKKEEAKRKRDEERDAKRREAEAKRNERERAKQKREAERRARQLEAERKQAARLKEADEKRKAAEKAKREAEEKKAAAAKKKKETLPAKAPDKSKRPAAKKEPARKPAPKAQKPAQKAPQKPPQKPPKKPAKPAAGRSAAKAKTTRKGR